MKKILFLVDQYGYTPNFVIKKDEQYHSLFGSIMTLCLFGISLIAILVFTEELFAKESPSVNLSTTSNQNPSKISFFDNFEFMIGIQNPNYVVEINETIFSAKGFLFRTKVNETGSYNDRIEINLEPCETALKESKNYEYFKNYELSGYYCFSKNQPSGITQDDLYINEFWGNDGFQMLQVKFYDCRNGTSNITCAPEETIDEYLRLTDLSLFIIDNYITTRDYKHPFRRGPVEKFYYVSRNFQVSLTEYIRHFEVISDDGLLFTTENKQETFKLDNMVDYTIYQRESETFVSFSIQLNNIKEIYYRKYYKFQDLAAQVGGIYKILVIVFYVITKLHSEHSYYQHLIKNFYEIKFNNSNNNIIKIPPILDSQRSNSKAIANGNKNKHHHKINTMSSLNGEQDNNSNCNNQKDEFTKEKQLKQILKQKGNKRFNIPFVDKLFLITVCPGKSRSKKKGIDQMYIQGRDLIDSYLEIDTVLKRFHNQEHISSLMLSEEQKKLFHYIFKPILTPNYFGTRYSKHNLPSKIKEKVVEANPMFNQKVIDMMLNNKHNHHNGKVKEKYNGRKESEEMYEEEIEEEYESNENGYTNE